MDFIPRNSLTPQLSMGVFHFILIGYAQFRIKRALRTNSSKAIVPHPDPDALKLSMLQP
jgi:hypothetical protein